MPIDRYDKTRFEAALPPGSQCLGLQKGQYVYTVPAGDHADVIVYSSIGQDGLARDVSEDSIKIMLGIPGADGKMMYRSVLNQDYVTRVAGWEERLREKCGQVAQVAQRIKQAPGLCPTCGQPRIVLFAKKDGRPFAKCVVHDAFTWLDQQEKAAEEKKPADKSVSLAKAADAIDASSLWDDNEHELQLAEIAAKKPIVFNEWQQKIIVADPESSSRVLATAGSGKTTVMAERYRYMVEELGIDPARILVVTFGNAAAADMKERFGQRCPSIKANPAALGNICTIHAACRRLLDSVGRANKELPKGYVLETKLREITQRYWGVEGGNTLSIDDEIDGASAALPKWHEVWGCILYLYGQGLGRNEQLPVCKELWGDFHGPLVAQARIDLDSWFSDQKLWTFAHMLYEVDWILTHAFDPSRPSGDPLRRVAAEWMSKFSHVIVDEAQDTNEQSMRILCALAGGKITVVGDPDQTMYRFAGGVPDANLYSGFTERFPNGNTFFLPINYRSTRRIVATQSQVALRNYQQYGGPWDDAYIKPMQPRPDAEEGSEIEFFMWDDAEHQARETVRLIEGFLAGKYKPGDIFVLCRTRAMTVHFESELLKAGLPFINTASGSFWLQPHVARHVGYLRLAASVITGREDAEAFRRVYNVATKFFRARGAYSSTRMLGEKFLQACNNKYAGAHTAASGSRFWAHGVDDLTTFVETIMDYLQDRSVGDALQLIYDDCLQAYTRDQQADGDDAALQNLLEDLETVIDIGRRFGTDMSAFLEYVNQCEEAAKAAKDKDWSEYIVLATVHKVKGQERDIVFVPGACEGEDESGPYGLLPHTYALRGGTGQEGVLASPFVNGIEDERCIFFVAISRARKHLIVSGVNDWRGRMMGPSRFVYEAGIAGR